MPSFIVLVAVFSLTVNMALHVAAQDIATNTDDDYNTESDEDTTSQEDNNQNLDNSILTQIYSSFTTMPEDIEADSSSSDPVIHVAFDLESDFSEVTEISTDISSQFSTTDTPFQTLLASGHQVGRFDLSQVSESVEQKSSMAISEMSVIHGFPEDSTPSGFSSRLEPTPPATATFVLRTSGFTHFEAVTSAIKPSTAATDEFVSSLTLHDSFLSSIHETNFHWTRSSEAHQHWPTSSVFEEFQAVSLSYLSTIEHAESTSIEHPESTATEQAEYTSTEHPESTSIEHPESTSTEHPESTSTEISESTFTEHAGATSREHIEATSTEHTESSIGHAGATSTEHAGATSTQHTESISIEHTESTSIEHAGATSTEHAGATSTEHAGATSIEHTESTSIEHAGATSIEHAGATSIEHAGATSIEHAGATSIEHAGATSIEHAGATSIEHAGATSIEHAGATSIEHAGATSIEHAGATSIEHTESTSIEHAGATSTEHAGATSIEHAGATSIEQTESTSIGHAGATSTEHTESTSTEHAGATSIEQTESTSIGHAGATSIEHTETTSTENAEATSTRYAESSSTEQAEFLSTTSEVLRIFSQPSLQTHLGASVVFSAGLPTSDALISTDTLSDLVSAASGTTGFVLLSSTAYVTSANRESTQFDETAERESSTFVPSHECPSCSSLEHSLEDIVSTTVHAMISSTFPSALHVQTSASDTSLTSSHFDTKITFLVDTVFHTASHVVGSEAQFSSTLSLLPVPTQFLPTSWDIRVPSKEPTAATTSLHTPLKEHTSSSHTFEDTPRSYITSSVYSSLNLTQGGGFSSDNVLHSEESLTSRYDAPNVSDIPLSSLRYTSSRVELFVVSTYNMSYTSYIVTSFGYDRIHASEAIDTSIHGSRLALKENYTSGYPELHTMEEIDTSRYETLHISGSASSDFSSHYLIHDLSTPSESLERSLASELPETPFEESQTVRTYVYSASLIPASSTSSGTRLPLTTSVRTSYHPVPESLSLLSQWESGRIDVGGDSLSPTLTSTQEDVLTSGQGLPVTLFETTHIITGQISLTSTRSFLETSFGVSTILPQFSTSMQSGLLTSTTSILTKPPKATNTTSSPTTVEVTTPHFETSTDVVHKTMTNFTIAIYFDGDCEKATEKKYTGILKAKMFQFIQNVSQIDDESRVFIGHISCNPSHIPITFVQADRTLVFLYLNDTFSNSPKYLRIHSMVLKLTGYSLEPDAQKRKGESEITPTDITIFATASCICLVLIIAGLAIFAKEIYHKKFAHRFSSPCSLGMPLKTETVALRSVPTNKSDYKHVEMNEEAFVNEAYTSRDEDEYASVTRERKTTFPSSEPNSPEEPRDATRSKKASEKNTGGDTKSAVSSSSSLSNGTSRHESPGYGLIIGLMGYTKRLERQQKRKQHQQQQQKLHFEESSYYAVPQKRSKPPKNQDNTEKTASPPPASYNPASRPVTIEDSPIPPPRHLRTLHEVNELYESNEELVPFTSTTGVDDFSSFISRTVTGLDNPSFLHERGHVDSTDVFHF